MSDIISSIKSLAPSLVATSAVAATGGDANGMLVEAQVKAAELFIALNNILSILAPGDVNISGLQGMSNSVIISTSSLLGQLFFNVPAQSGHIATVLNFG